MKDVIVEVDLYYQIRSLYNEGESIRSIARRLGVSRPTVKKYCEGNTLFNKEDYERISEELKEKNEKSTREVF